MKTTLLSDRRTVVLAWRGRRGRGLFGWSLLYCHSVKTEGGGNDDDDDDEEVLKKRMRAWDVCNVTPFHNWGIYWGEESSIDHYPSFP